MYMYMYMYIFTHMYMQHNYQLQRANIVGWGLFAGHPREVENMAMAGGKIPGTELYYPIKSDHGPLGRHLQGKVITSPPNKSKQRPDDTRSHFRPDRLL